MTVNCLRALLLMFAALASTAALAGELEEGVATRPTVASAIRAAGGVASLIPQRDRRLDTPMRTSALAQAISSAAKKGIVEAGVEAGSEILLQCQQARSVVLTTPLLRSDSQQAHCYRF